MSHTITPSSVLDNVVKPTTAVTSEIPNVPQQDAVAVSIPEPNPRTVGNDPILNALLQTPKHLEAGVKERQRQRKMVMQRVKKRRKMMVMMSKKVKQR